MDIMFFLLWSPAFLALGALSGVLAGLLGVGGGLVLVPGLYALFVLAGGSPDSLMHIAVGTSLAIIVPTGLSSALAHWRRGAVRTDVLRRIAPGVVAGVVIGIAVAGHVSGGVLGTVFAVTLLGLSVVMAFGGARFTLAPGGLEGLYAAAAGAVIGGVSTVMGIGGATISVPYMTACRVPVHQAIATAAALGVVIAVPAAVGFIAIGQGASALPYTAGYINIPALLLAAPMAVMTAPFGAHLAHRLPVAPLRRIFAVVMALVALRMLHEVWHG